MYRKILVPVMGLALAGMAGATTTFYTDQSLFNAATSGLTFQTISDFASSELSSSAPLTDPSTGVIFSDQIGFSSNLGVVNTSTLKVNSGFSMGIQVPSTYVAYWFDIVTLSQNGLVTVSSTSPSSNAPITTPGNPGTLTFYGVVTDTAVGGLQLAGANGIEIANFNVASAASGGGGGGDSEAPEATTMLTIGTGLILLRALRRRTALLPPDAEPSQLC
ncbi:MAG TPA: hypothetical protein VKR43_17005 [Bryobacteraceae bacterium]|nr:hypothetical protein [Bryobacteraceae bacterium]